MQPELPPNQGGTQHVESTRAKFERELTRTNWLFFLKYFQPKESAPPGTGRRDEETPTR